MAQRRRGSWASLLFLVALLATLDACSGARFRVQRDAAPIDAKDLDQRVRLGHLNGFGELDGEQARLREAATFAAEIGNQDEAAGFAREQLDLARAQLLAVRLDGGDDPDYKRALDELDEAARFAVEIGDEVLDATLVIEAGQFMSTPKLARKTIARALTVAREADLSWGYTRLWEVFANDPDSLTALQRLRWRSFRGAGLPEGSPRLAPESLALAGSAANDLLWVEANRAAVSGRRDDLDRWVDALYDVDRHNPHTLAVRVVLAALERGEIEDDRALLPDLSSNSADPLGGRARMLLRQQAHPESSALALYRAEAMVANGTFGDAGQVLTDLELDGAPAIERALRAELLALVALESGTEVGRSQFLGWRRRAGAQHSSALNQWISNYEQETAPPGHVELAQAADRDLVSVARGRNIPRLPTPVLWSAAINKDSTAQARERALAGLAGRDPNQAARVAICRERKLYGEDCRDLLGELIKLDYANAEYVAGLDALSGAANVRSSWFTQVPWLEADDMPEVRDRLVEYEGTRVSATTEFQTAALFAELAANRPDLARARLDRVGPLLRPETRAIATMALLDLEQGLVEPRDMPNLLLELPSADVDAAWFEERWLPGDPSVVGDMFPGRSRLARFARGLALARMGAWDSATAELLLIVDELEGVAQTVVAGRLLLAAQLAGQTGLRDRALTLVEGRNSRSFVVPYVRAQVAESALDKPAAHAQYLLALTRRPRSLAAFEGAIRTLDHGKRDIDRVRDAILLFPDPSVHWHASELLEYAASGEIDGLILTNLWLARERPATLLGIGEPAAKVGPLAERGLDRLLEELQLATDPAAAFPIAAKVLAWIGAMPSEMRVDYREVELWLTFLIGRDEELFALAQAQPRYGGFYEPPALLHSTLLLASARKSGALDDSLAWAIVGEELWSADDPVTRSLVGDLYAPIANPALAQYACLRLFQRDEIALGAERCVPLWNEIGGSPFLAIDLAFLALNDPDLARAHGLDIGAFFTAASQMPLLDSDPVWLLNASLWQSKLGDHAAGSNLRTRQLALEALVAPEPDALEFAQAQYRGPLLRQQIVNQFEPTDRRRFALAAGSALRSLDLLAAELYAQRLLAWLPPLGEEDMAPEFTARSPQMLAAERIEGDTSDAELRSSGLYVLAISQMIASDLDEGWIEREAMIALLDAYADDAGAAALERLVADHPESHTAKLLLLAEYGDTGGHDEGLPLARELVALVPDNPLVLANALPLLIGNEDLPEARRLLADARERYPNHPWLRDESLPALLTGAEGGIPSWLRSVEGFDGQLATLSDADLDALDPVRIASVDTAAEVFLSSAFELTGEGIAGRQDIPGFEVDPEDPDAFVVNRALFVIREPRASRCEGIGCAEETIAEWNARGFALLWAREIELPGGEGIEFLVTDGESVIDSVMIPTGGNVFILLAGTLADDMSAFLPHIKLQRDSFRPLDWTLAAAAAETMREAGGGPTDERARLNGRRLLARAELETPEQAQTCPITELLASAEARERPELLVDLLLAARDPLQRRALLACTAPDQPEAARLALLALLDEDAVVHGFGRAATTHHHGQVVTDTRRILYDELQPAVSNPNLTLNGEQPVFGLLQVIAALPDQQARDLTRALLGRRDPRLRALALAASATMDYFEPGTDPAQVIGRTEVVRLREVVREGEMKDALVAAASLVDLPGPENLAALRDRADKLIDEGIVDDNGRGLAIGLAWGLARILDGGDRKRLVGLAKAIELDPEDGKDEEADNVREAIEEMAEDHAEARKALSRREVEFDNERVGRWVRANSSMPAPRNQAELRDKALAELTPGTNWTFVRVGNAGLFAASLEGLLRRLAPAKAADAYLVRALIHDSLLQGSFALLREGGGLDLSQPIECVSPKDSPTFACSATLSDPDAALSVLARRELGDDAGVAVPLDLATEFAGLPVMLGMLPVALHSLVEAPDDELDSDESPQVAAERLRRSRVVAGHELEYYATIEIHEDDIVVDSEHYLVVGNRLLVFSSVDVAEQILREAPKSLAPLAEAEAFAAAVERWTDGVALQAVDFTEELGLPEMSLEVVLGNEGMVFSARGRGDRKTIGDYGLLAELLPREPVASAALALEPDSLREYFEDTDIERCYGFGSKPATAEADDSSIEDDNEDQDDERCGLAATDKFPPVELAEHASATLLGWYPELGNSLWQDWVLLMPLDAKLTREAKRWGLKLPAAGQLTEHAGLWWLVRDGALAVASNETLATAVRDRPALATGADTPANFASFGLDGQRAAETIRALAERYEGETRGNFLRVIATVIGLVDHVEVEGHWAETDSDEGLIEATVALNLAESEEELELINQWLASPEVSNASRLPRRVSRSETDQGLVYTIQVLDAAQFAKTAIPDDNPRISVEVVSPTELRLTVLPSRGVSTSATALLETTERERMLDSDSMIRASAPEIREIANSLRVSGDEAATVAKVVDWVHQHVQYEITPTSLDAVTILDRATGDCTEYALLTVTLLRAAGIPAKLQEGMAASGEEMVAHAWVAWHDGTRWREVDPTAGTDSVSSGHLELEVVDVLAMISLGQFEVTAIEKLDP